MSGLGSDRVLIVASGLSKPVQPDFEGHEYTESYSDVSINPDDYEGKSVLILGKSACFMLCTCVGQRGVDV